MNKISIGDYEKMVDSCARNNNVGAYTGSVEINPKIIN
jgi:hypothetical protein